MNLDAWLSLLEQRHPKTIDLGLERCGSVYQRLGSPRPANRVYTVAGTNGKGSTVAYLAALSSSLGQRVGTFTSPHIFRFNERISVMGKPVSDEQLVAAFEQVEAVRNGVSLTYFEFTTLAGMLILNQSELDCAVLEVGLGGRLDTVNLVDADCAVITPIGLDHQEYLGPDLDSIAAEKAGIIRSGAPVVCTEPNPPAPVLQVACDLAAPLFCRGTDFDLVPVPSAANGRLLFLMDNQSIPISSPSMDGKHQLDNLAAAMAALYVLNPGIAAKAEEISAAIRACKVPGRLQKVASSPDIILDVGHNELAAMALAGYLEDRSGANTICVLAMLADKPAGKVAMAMEHVCTHWLCAGSEGPRGQTGEQLADRVKRALPAASVTAFESPADAIESALSLAAAEDVILVFGSFLTVASAAEWLSHGLQHDGHDADRINPNISGKGLLEKSDG